MRFFICCLGLMLAQPALANSIEDGICQARTQPVIQMEGPEKLCRSFVRALGKLPVEATREVQALLTPESLAAMSTLTAAWLGAQGVPIVGQVVDAALLSLGVIALTAQAGMIADALWTYANRASGARSDADLDAAATHLARAMATAGVTVVTIILTKKIAGKAGPKPSELEPLSATRNIRAPHASAMAVSASETATEIPALAASGVRSSANPTQQETASPKKVDLESFKAWLAQARRRPTRESPEPYAYQRKHAGPEEFLVSGGGEQIWADGARLSNARLVEVKHIDAPERSPFIPGSKCNERIRLVVQEDVIEEFRRYAAVIKDPATPPVGLEVVVNDTRAAPFFEALLRQFNLSGEVLVRP
ncbi:restriction endonuclease fold toxin-2 domain-containing protein [Archangium lipolyticum]|uniref:restriction endonuclease fold toxin-2 domain-containing protein n=1 Tax=Archangium lipolyticum TaxID=2970465 RepID=UPI002149C957|nr:restriction endonuclease fold toxin-2 domain-containing protein [Archangium lipolyticum]